VTIFPKQFMILYNTTLMSHMKFAGIYSYMKYTH